MESQPGHFRLVGNLAPRGAESLRSPGSAVRGGQDGHSGLGFGGTIQRGLLLSALWDAAFDRGLVTFAEDGRPDFSQKLTIRQRGGRPRILPPKEVEVEMERGQDPHVLRAMGLTWRWRQLIERGEVTTLADLAAKECFSDR